ncbi:hypothetical protein [Falsiruegeria litorea]|nr:hypothetical protein [Falsiruegeria litorea]MBT8169507.1 hypothetical protein [Falsiruegeria litorea]
MTSKGSYVEFRDALSAFESGWDRDRYESGNISDAQLTQWAGGPVTEFFPNYSSWGDLTDQEWDAMSYQSTNSLGFVGYQFGEALLIDLGYYDDDKFYGNGESTNTWDGAWTGKNGVNSLDEFKTKAAQEVAIQEAFGHNLKIIQNGLAQQGKTLGDFLGTTTTYNDNGTQVTVELTLTGIMAAAHLRGAFGTLNLLLNGAVSNDEYGTSILRYVDQFGGYDGPSVDEAIEFFESRITGDEGLGTPDGGGPDPVDPDPTPTPDPDAGDGFSNGAITKENADVVVTWSWGTTRVVTDFDPAQDTLFIDWFSAEQLEIEEAEQGLVLSVGANNQTLTLQGVTFADLVPTNINALDASLRAELVSLTDITEPGDGDDHGDGHSDGDGHGGMDGTMTTITLTSGNQTVDGFDITKDMVHIEGGITAERLQIFEESGDALGLTTRIVVTDSAGAILSTTILKGVALSDLTLSNFSIAEQSALNEVAPVIGTSITDPGDGLGYDVVYDSDGSNPPAITGETVEGGVRYRADVNADDIIGFDPAQDQLDFGGTSVHGMIVTKTPAGEIAIDSPWSAQLQVIKGVGFEAVTIDSFGVVGNEHLRQDMGGVVSWEQGVGPRNADTVYVRSHEYGVQEVVNDFDPSTQKISFLYFGTRERLSVEDTDGGLVISSLPAGQSVTLVGVELADLVPGRVEFHHDQVMEDNLEVPFGFDQNDVTLVDRTVLLTPTAPAGDTTDGHQTRTGDMGGGTDPGDTDGGTDPGNGDGEPGSGDEIQFVEGTQDRVEVTWDWASEITILGFDPEEDVIDFNALAAENVSIREADGDLLIEVLGNGGNITTLNGIQAEDLILRSVTAEDWNEITDLGGALIQQLVALDFSLG